MSAKRAAGWFMALLALLLAACQPALTPAPLPKVELVTVQLTPALRGLLPQINSCARETAGVGIIVNETPTASLDTKSTGIILRWGAPEQLPASAVVVGQQPLVVIAHPSNPLQKITLAQLKAIYSGMDQTWGDVLKEAGALEKKDIHSYAYPASEDIQQITANLLGPDKLKAGISYLAPHPEAVRQAVAADPQAVGFIPQRDLDSSVKVLPIASTPEEKLQQPILALSNVEPQGAARQWLGCLETKLK